MFAMNMETHNCLHKIVIVHAIANKTGMNLRILVFNLEYAWWSVAITRLEASTLIPVYINMRRHRMYKETNLNQF